MLSQKVDAGSVDDARRLAFLPTFAVLGVALPLSFLATIEQYLYYLRPWELIPTYGTAWLLLAAVVAPASLVSWLTLTAFDRPTARRISAAVRLILISITAATLLGTGCYATLAWMRTFGLLVTSHMASDLTVLSLTAGVLAAIASSIRIALVRMFPLMKYVAGLGALSLVSLPYSGWSADQGSPRATTRRAATGLSSPPHILLVTIDALSAEHMSLYGAQRDTTPRLKAFAHGATTFDRAYANGNLTTPGVSSILTATRPWTHRAVQIASWPLPTERRNSLPALLSEAGYQTASIATNPNAGAAKNGLGAYFSFRASDRLQDPSACSDGLATLLRYDCAANQLASVYVPEMLWIVARRFITHNAVNRESDPQLAMRPALEWLGKVDKQRPVFLWVHFMPPHAPYAAPEPWLGQFDSSPAARRLGDSNPDLAFLFRRTSKQRAALLEARYDESVKYVDFFVGEFLERAQQLLGPNTVVIVTADHGESFAHGYGAHGGPCLYESLIHIPLLIKAPFQAQELHTLIPAEQVDIAPTVAALAGISAPPSWEGRSLLPLLKPSESEVPMPAKPVFAMSFEENPRRLALTTGSVAVIDGRWKLVHFMGALHYSQMPQLHDELYDLGDDPRELTNRVSEEAAEAVRLRNLIFVQLARRGGPLP